MYTLIYYMILPIYGVLWRANRSLAYSKMWARHGSTHQITTFYPGCGLHFKFILTDKKSGHQSLVKTTSCLVEWWQDVVFRWKIEAGLNLEYPGRSFEEIANIIKEYCTISELYQQSYINNVDINAREIWYDYHPYSRIANGQSAEDIRLVNALWSLLETYGFYYVDQSFDNVLIENHKAFLVDLESLVKLRSQNTESNT